MQAGGHRFDPVNLHRQRDLSNSYLENWILRNNELKKHRKLRGDNITILYERSYVLRITFVIDRLSYKGRTVDA